MYIHPALPHMECLNCLESQQIHGQVFDLQIALHYL